MGLAVLALALPLAAQTTSTASQATTVATEKIWKLETTGLGG
jgi:hypothetical protein